jgi:DNA topoisomerase-1
MASLFKTMEPGSISIDDAVKLLSLPRMVGSHPDDGTEILALNGRYGPFIKWGKETRSLETEDQIFSTSLEGAVELLAKPKQRRGAKPPIKELGTDPVTGKEILIKDGRFGLYMTDGETNVSFRKAETIENVTLEGASDRLAEKRAKGPAPRKKRS